MKRRQFLTTSTTLLAGSSAMAASAASAASPAPGQETPLPDFPPASRLLFQGDSITDMKWGRNQKDRNHYLGHSYVFLLAARIGVDMATTPLEFFNRGISGHRVANLRKRWTKDAIELKPDLLSVLIGTNDVGGGVTPEAFESDYRWILDASRKANPALRLVLLDPFVLQCGPLKEDQAWQRRRAATDKLGEVVAKLVADYGAVHIKTQQIFDTAASEVSPEHWIWDGIHPLPQGHELIARAWRQAVSERWPQR